MTSRGLHAVSSEDLKRLLRALHRGALPSPITRSALIEKAFGHIEGHLDGIVGHGVDTAKAVVGAVLNERGGSGLSRVSLVYMGAPAPGTRSRDVLAQVEELVSSATRSVELYGLGLGDDRGLLRSVVAIMQGRSAAVRLVFDGAHTEDAVERARELVRDRFRRGETPEVFVALTRRLRLRAAIVDAARALVVSGELSATEDDETLDLGALIDDPTYIAAWHAEWDRLVQAGACTKLAPL